MDDKAALREELRQARAALDEPARLAASARLAARVLSAPEFAAARVVLVYAAMRDEVDPVQVVAAALAQGSIVAFPQTDWAARRIVPVRLRSPDQPRPGHHGVPELPDDALEPVDPATLDLVLVPGVGFDLQGHRLGYGGGFYDRLLAALPGRTRRWGLAFEAQIVDALPALPHDQRVDALFTEARRIDLERARG